MSFWQGKRLWLEVLCPLSFCLASLASAQTSTFWAFQPVRTSAPPSPKKRDWVQNPIDAFILAKLEKAGIPPAPPADRRTLLRRVTFDLIGLPPTPQEVESFLEDSSQNAFEKVVDRLLASPHYGERWGRHWLDVVRYADSLDKRDTGTIRDFNEMWRYRDWVVRALNQDMPFDLFVLNQIAGDTLPAPLAGDPNIEGTIATGMLAVGHWSNGDADKIKMLTDIADDQIDAVGRGFMGLTVACARCHDHKFDPISTKDYYGLAGIFLSTHILPRPAPNDAVETPLKIPLLTQKERQEREAYALRLSRATQELQNLQEPASRAFSALHTGETARYLMALWEYRVRPPHQKTLSLEEFALQRKLLPHALRQWNAYLNEGGYIPLQKPLPNIEGYASIYAWMGEEPDSPVFTLNGNMAPRTLGTATYPSLTLGANPGKHGFVLSWRSPIEGYVNVLGGLSTLDSKMSTATRWTIAIRTPAGERILARGSLDPKSEMGFSAGVGGQDLTSILVHPDDRLQLKILPNTDPIHQNIQIQFGVAERDGERRWSLFDDVAESFLQEGRGNPHADKQGNQAVWCYYGIGEARQRQEQDRNLQRALRRYEAACQEPNTPAGDKERAEAAIEVQNALTTTDSANPFAIREPQDWKYLPQATQERLQQSAERLSNLKKQSPPPIPYANGAQEGGCPRSPYAGFQDAAVYKRGDYHLAGETVPRRFPAVLSFAPAPRMQGSGRLQLAQWLTDPRHPLTARVIVNRLWQHHFGEGIVRTPNNFGLLGERPTHPELLDWLASELIRRKWSLKQMHRLMLLSGTYQQSSVASPLALAKDVDNRLLSRASRRRLEAEAIRDSLLMVSGKLDTRMGGVGDRDPQSQRRTLYLMTIRSEKSGFCPLFDSADPTSIVEKRTVSTIAPQSLYFLNHRWLQERAQSLAVRLQTERKQESLSAKIEWLYTLLFARKPTPDETKIGEGFLNSSAITEEGLQDYIHLLLCTNEFLYFD